MDVIRPLLLGILQGLTEFLPVSSSGHLEIGKVLLGLEGLESEDSMMMTVLLHVATALSTVVVFRQEVSAIVRGLLQGKWNDDWSFSAKIVLSMIPAVVVGITLEDQIESLFGGTRTLGLVGVMLIFTGVLLFLAGRARQTEKHVGYGAALIVGLAQAIAILPGISRSGATISTSVLLGIDRSKAARFSFLMVVPLIFGKIAKDCLDAFLEGTLTLTASTGWLELTVGFLAAFVTGVLACKWMILLVKNLQLWWFSIYCFLVGSISLAYGVLG